MMAGMDKPESKPPELAPGEKPMFMQPAAATSPYPGAPDPNKVAPTFDDELDILRTPFNMDDIQKLRDIQLQQRREEDARIQEFENLLPDVQPGLRARYLEVARLHASGLLTNAEIARRLGYTTPAIAKILEHPNVQREIAKFRMRVYDQDVASALKEMGPDSIAVIREMLLSTNEKLKDRSETAWKLIEKLTGKARQEINVESNTLTAYMDMVRQMHSRGERLDAPPIIDVTPQVAADLPKLEAGERDLDSEWIKNNI